MVGVDFQADKVCFCSLAIGKRYHSMVQDLAKGIAKNCPGTSIVVLTEKPRVFRGYNNVLAFKHRQQGTLFPYHDKAFVIEKALSLFNTVIFVDADTKMGDSLKIPKRWNPGICTNHHTDLIDHITKNCPQRLEYIKK